VNVERICRVLSEDWGFYYTVTTNFGKISEYAKNLEGLQEDDRNGILSKIDQLRNAIESSPKSLGWKMRARVGATKKWYEDVEELYGGH
jgi:predicted SPOUT superfamily RNA methylase MTH1